MEFTFDYYCDKAPLSLTIEVSCSIWTWPGSYDEPAECCINDLKYTLKCGSIDMTDFITQTIYDTPLSNEVLQAIEDEIWERYEKY